VHSSREFFYSSDNKEKIIVRNIPRPTYFYVECEQIFLEIDAE
jgi:hypothetical protein